MTRIIGKKYYRIIFQLTSPLSIGSGNDIQTDQDVLLDGRELPVIPASAIAGVSREAVRAAGVILPGGDITYFGEVPDSVRAKTEQARESLLIFYDANVAEEDEKKVVISVRDQVALDKYKTAVKGAKFDMQVVEPDIRFVTYLEQNYIEEAQFRAGDLIANIWQAGGICLGAKSTRGYGHIKIDEIRTKTFAFSDLMREKDDGAGTVTDWLEFDVFSTDSWENGVPFESGKAEGAGVSYPRRKLRIKLQQVGGLSIRVYSTTPSAKEDLPEPDFRQITLAADKDKEPIPVIPGTSWAGAFRHHMEQLIPGCTKGYFGKAEGKKVRSGIRFSESRLTGDNLKEKILTRNAIDRISGGTASTALFTEQTCYGGETELEIEYTSDISKDPDFCSALAAAIEDMHWGFMAVGGETAIGRGLFRVVSVNGEPIGKESETDYKQGTVYNMVVSAMRGTEEAVCGQKK